VAHRKVQKKKAEELYNIEGQRTSPSPDIGLLAAAPHTPPSASASALPLSHLLISLYLQSKNPSFLPRNGSEQLYIYHNRRHLSCRPISQRSPPSERSEASFSSRTSTRTIHRDSIASYLTWSLHLFSPAAPWMTSRSRVGFPPRAQPSSLRSHPMHHRMVRPITTFTLRSHRPNPTPLHGPNPLI
jgi:hypothetical protein